MRTVKMPRKAYALIVFILFILGPLACRMNCVAQSAHRVAANHCCGDRACGKDDCCKTPSALTALPPAAFTALPESGASARLPIRNIPAKREHSPEIFQATGPPGFLLFINQAKGLRASP